MIRGRLALRAAQLVEAREAFVEATVVRAQRPTSVRPGDPAIVLADGTIEGFVGGVCAESSVRLHALRALETGEPLLLRLVPEEVGPGGDAGAAAGASGAGAAAAPETAGAPAPGEGAVTEHNPCLSGGALEIFLEPCLPSPRLVVVGDAPVAEALGRLGEELGFAVTHDAPGADDAALVVASHGRDEGEVLAAALRDGVAYVGLVASARRGASVRAALDVPDELRAQLHTPAGLAIGARTPSEIALSILAEIVAERRGASAEHAPAASGSDTSWAARSAAESPGGEPRDVERGARGAAPPAAAAAIDPTADPAPAHACCDHHAGAH